MQSTPGPTGHTVHTLVFSHLADADPTPQSVSTSRAEQAARRVRFRAPSTTPVSSRSR